MCIHHTTRIQSEESRSSDAAARSARMSDSTFDDSCSHEIRSTVGRSFLIEDLPRTQLTYDTTYRSGSSTHPCATRPGARTSRRMGDLSRPRPRTVPSRSARARQRSGIQRPGRATRCSASIRPPTRTIDFGLRARESQQARVRGGRGSQGACLGRGRVRRRRSNPKGRTGG